MKREKILSEIRAIELAWRLRSYGDYSSFYTSVYKGSGSEFDGLREYSEQDDYRYIDWNAAAKTGKLFTRILREERELELYLLVDISSSMLSGGALYPPRKTKLETAAVAAAIFAFSAAMGRDKAGAVFFAGQMEEVVAATAGRVRAFSIAEKILDYGSIKGKTKVGKNSPLAEACAALPAGFRKKGICVIISDMGFPLSPAFNAVSAISSRFAPLLLCIRDPSEKDFVSPYSYQGFDADIFSGDGTPVKNRSTFFVNSFSKGKNSKSGKDSFSTLNQDSDKSTELSVAVEKAAAKAAIPSIILSTDDNIPEKIASVFRAWGR